MGNLRLDSDLICTSPCIHSSDIVDGTISVADLADGSVNSAKIADGSIGVGDLVNVALLGVVPVKVTAENGAIRVGDLLTTSSTPGHAMKCQDKFLCFGATLGKALESLEKGTGVIKALVMLR